jgi:hypothetical protein
MCKGEFHEMGCFKNLGDDSFRRLWMTLAFVYAQEQERTSYLPVDIKETFAAILSRMAASKAGN